MTQFGVGVDVSVDVMISHHTERIVVRLYNNGTTASESGTPTPDGLRNALLEPSSCFLPLRLDPPRGHRSPLGLPPDTVGCSELAAGRLISSDRSPESSNSWLCRRILR